MHYWNYAKIACYNTASFFHGETIQMAQVIPFKGLLYNVPKVSKVSGSDLLAPPYDIITPRSLEDLYNKSPYNIVRIDFGKIFPADNDSENRYTRAKSFLDAWINEGTLTEGKSPCFYSYEISYRIGSKAKKLRGFLGLVKLEQLGKGNIYPHEYTHSKPKKDRLDLMRICRANISPIFSLYNSSEKKTSALLEQINRGNPYIDATDMDGSVHRLWEISDPAAIDTIRRELDNKAVFIADGHHRYETALEYQKEMRSCEGGTQSSGDGDKGGNRPYDYVLMFLANMADEGLTILPTHRLVKEIPHDALELLSNDFDIEEMTNDFNIPGAIEGRRDVYGFYTGGKTWYRLSYKGEGFFGVPQALKDLDVTILHDLIFKQLLDVESVAYEMDVNKCLQAVRAGEYAGAFFLNPTQVYDVEKVALASLRMPPKSTYFYPKLLTGMAINKW